jgi:YggT family protein
VIALGLLIELVLYTFLILLIIRFIVDWIQVFARHWSPRGPVLIVLEGVYTLTDPPIKAFRRVLPPLRLGGIMLDLSFLATILVCYLLLNINRAVLL